MSNYEVFANEVINALKAQLPEASIEAVNVVKNNGVTFHGITIKENVNIAPQIYLDDYFKAYEDGRTMDEIISKIFDCYKASKVSTNFDVSCVTDFSKVADKLYVTLVNRALNLDDVKVVRRPVEDLYMVAKILLCPDAVGGGMASVTVTKELAAQWNKSEDEILDAAIANSMQILPAEARPMVEVLAEACGGICPFGDEESLPMYVVTNSTKVNGASAILYDGVLSSIADKFDDDLVIIPSSIHECIIIPSEQAGQMGDLAMMICQVNQTEVAENEILSDHAYFFNRETAVLSAAA